MTGARYRIESFYLLHFDSIIVHKQQTRVIPGLLHVGSPSRSLSLSLSRQHTFFFLCSLVLECLDGLDVVKEIPN